MPECPIPVLSRLENNFYEINVKLKLKPKKIQEGRRSICIQTHLGKKCLCRDKYYVESFAKCNVNKTLQWTLVHKVQMFRDLIALKCMCNANLKKGRITSKGRNG